MKLIKGLAITQNSSHPLEEGCYREGKKKKSQKAVVVTRTSLSAGQFMRYSLSVILGRFLQLSSDPNAPSPTILDSSP